ncbi:hypothetical protein M2138_000549 [Dysgonomonadaceae bacterium PH5-43]|nr:hypothetical protein [Dysgonomonadaceae bacterium PH5-43]
MKKRINIKRPIRIFSIDFTAKNAVYFREDKHHPINQLKKSNDRIGNRGNTKWFDF